MKKGIYNLYLFILHFFIYFSCYLNLPKFCAYLVKISFYKPKLFRNKSKNKKLFVILNRSIGGFRDIELVHKSSNQTFEFIFMRRSVVKIVSTCFINKKKIFLNYFKPRPLKKDFLNQKLDDKRKHQEFWTKVIFNLKSYYRERDLNFVTFAYYYDVEFALFEGCKNNNIPVKLWSKENFLSEPDMKIHIKINEYKYAFNYFHKISVYNELMKKMLIGMNKSNKKKITINGCPRIFDFIDKKKKYKKIKNILFLSFNRQGIPETEKYKKLDFGKSHDKVIKILNDLSKNKDLNIYIKRKNILANANTYRTSVQIDSKIKIFEEGTAEKFINEADIVIGLNSSAVVEALANGKYVMVPFFEKKSMYKYLYKFNKNIIYNCEKKIKKDILKLANKRVLFPLKNKEHKRTIQYYLGSSNRVMENYVKFLNS